MLLHNKFSTIIVQLGCIVKNPKVIVRPMQTARQTITRLSYHNSIKPMRAYSTRVGLKLKGDVAKNLSNDNQKGHTHAAEETCSFKNCRLSNCPGLCGPRDKTYILGHDTHKPPVGRFARYVSDTDTNGDPKDQYHVKTNTKVEVDEKQRQAYGKKIKEDPKKTAYIRQNRDKYD